MHDDRTREQKLYDALKRITMYDKPEKLHKRAERDYGLSGEEAIEMAYENVLQEAKNAIKGMRRPSSPVVVRAAAAIGEKNVRLDG